MSEQTVIAFVTAGGGVVVAAIGAVGVVLGLLWRRISQLETKLAKRDDHLRAVWWWARRIADLYYRHRKDNAPDLPDPPTEEEP